MPLNTCTKSTELLPLGYGYVLLAPALDIHHVSSSTGCAAASTLFTSITAAVGVASSACTALRPATGSSFTGFVAVQQTAAGGPFTIKGFLGSTSCAGSPNISFTAALNACTNADNSQASIQLGGLASAVQSYYAPTEVTSVALTLPATASAAALTLATMPAAMKDGLIGLVSTFLGVKIDFVTIVSVTAVGARRARALAASSYTFGFAVNTAALAVAMGKNGFSSSSVAVYAQASLLATINDGRMAFELNTAQLSSVKGGLGNPTTFDATTMSATASAAPVAPPAKEDYLPVGLGVGLGLGVPVVLAALYFLGCLKCGVKKPAEEAMQKGMAINVPAGATVVIQQGGAASGGTAV